MTSEEEMQREEEQLKNRSWFTSTQKTCPHPTDAYAKCCSSFLYNDIWDNEMSSLDAAVIADRVCKISSGLLSPIYPENVSFKGYRVISLETDVVWAISGLSSHYR